MCEEGSVSVLQERRLSAERITFQSIHFLFMCLPALLSLTVSLSLSLDREAWQREGVVRCWKRERDGGTRSFGWFRGLSKSFLLISLSLCHTLSLFVSLPLLAVMQCAYVCGYLCSCCVSARMTSLPALAYTTWLADMMTSSSPTLQCVAV